MSNRDVVMEKIGTVKLNNIFCTSCAGLYGVGWQLWVFKIIHER